MPVPPPIGGTVVFLPREALSAPVPSAEELLTLLRRRGHPLPPGWTLHIYPARHGLLLFLLPEGDALPKDPRFSRSFS